MVRFAAYSPRGPWRFRAPRLNDLCTGAAYWCLSGILVALGTSIGYSLLAPGPDSRATRRDAIEAIGVLDAQWYASIAERGYSYDPNSRSSVAFFPVYPLMGRAVASLLRIRTQTALLLVSNGSFLAALTVLASYSRERYASAPPGLADYVVVAAALFPTACFFRLAYSESTFLLLAAAAMYGIQRRWPLVVVALLAGLATATRPVGVALLAPLAFDVCRRHSSPMRRLFAMCVWLPCACWGLACYAGYQYVAFGDALAFAKTQRHWGVRAADLEGRLWACLTFEPIIAVYRESSPAFWARRDAHGLPWFSLQFANPLFLLAAVALLVAGTTRLVPSTQPENSAERWLNRYEISLAVLLLTIPYFTRGYEMGMASMGRFVAVAFPIYLTLGQLFSRMGAGGAAALLATSGFVMGCYSALFIAGYLIL